MQSVFDAYAAKICRHANLAPGPCDANRLNAIILALPLGEGHAVLDGTALPDLPRLGESIGLNAHMQANFFDVIGLPQRDLYEFTVPVLVARQHLQRLDAWRDWRMLTVYLRQWGLEPAIVFRNTPIWVGAAGKQSDYYVADIRVLFATDKVFAFKA